MAGKRRGLGSRDLDALLGGGDRGSAAGDAGDEGELRNLPVTAIQPGPWQPRRHWDEQRLAELAASIKSQGLIQPLVVRAIDGGRFELIAGERRWRAARQAGLDEVQALVKVVSDRAVPAMALIENIQRENLTALEEAQALQRLIGEFDMTHQQAADAVGRSRAAVSNLLRLLELPDAVARMLDQGQLEMGHARCLLTLPAETATALARETVARGWSVRELEQAARRAPRGGKRKAGGGRARDPDVAALERELSETLATGVSLVAGRGGRGKLVIQYHNPDQLEGVLDRLRGNT
ncbi:MAG TPA: ParB/RepB/Spo0J family partition protein [Rhodanobacteraceae bacterium]|nr:ParB/RepB/Spo0J family partition protein [Rhodanobacteraceae bacterium]